MRRPAVRKIELDATLSLRDKGSSAYHRRCLEGALDVFVQADAGRPALIVGRPEPPESSRHLFRRWRSNPRRSRIPGSRSTRPATASRRKNATPFCRCALRTSGISVQTRSSEDRLDALLFVAEPNTRMTPSLQMRNPGFRPSIDKPLASCGPEVRDVPLPVDH